MSSSSSSNLYYRLRGSPDIFTQFTEKRYSNVQYAYKIEIKGHNLTISIKKT